MNIHNKNYTLFRLKAVTKVKLFGAVLSVAWGYWIDPHREATWFLRRMLF